MSVEHWIFLAIFSSTLAFATSAREELLISEICDFIQRYYHLLYPMYDGCRMDFKHDDKILKGKGRIIPTKNLIISECKSWTIDDGSSSTAFSATIKDQAMVIMLQDSPWVEIIDPVMQIAMKSEDTDCYRKITVSSLRVRFTEALVNKTSLDSHSTLSVGDTLELRLNEFVASQSFKVDEDYEIEKNLVGKALAEMLKFQLFWMEEECD